MGALLIYFKGTIILFYFKYLIWLRKISLFFEILKKLYKDVVWFICYKKGYICYKVIIIYLFWDYI